MYLWEIKLAKLYVSDLSILPLADVRPTRASLPVIT